MGKAVVKAMQDTLDGKKVSQFIKTQTTIVDKGNWEKFR